MRFTQIATVLLSALAVGAAAAPAPAVAPAPFVGTEKLSDLPGYILDLAEEDFQSLMDFIKSFKSHQSKVGENAKRWSWSWDDFWDAWGVAASNMYYKESSGGNSDN